MTITTTESARRETTAATQLGARTVALYVCAAFAVEIAAGFGGPMVGAIGYAVLVLVIANHVAVRVLHLDAAAANQAAWFSVLAIPFVLRLATFALEPEPVVAVRHYAVIGGVALAAALAAVIAFPELRPRVGPVDDGWRQAAIGLAGIPLGLVLALVFARASVSPQHGRWQSTVPLVALLVGAALVEELIFRGVLQTALRGHYGRAVPLVGTAALTLAYLNVHPIGFVLAALALGLCAAIVVEWTGAIHGVVAARILLLVGLVYAWPRILHLE